MNVLELFSGSKSFAQVAKEGGHQVFTVDIEAAFDPDLVMDILELQTDMVPFIPDIVWASPPCTGFSVASIGRNWGGGKGAYEPKSDTAKLGIDLVKKTIQIIGEFQKKNPYLLWVIENPRGVLRKMPFMQDIGIHHTVSYCQYGDTRMKPTDIWTNIAGWNPRKICKNGDTCHEAAPRGSKTGTQGLKGSYNRSIVPKELCAEILKTIVPQDG